MAFFYSNNFFDIFIFYYVYVLRKQKRELHLIICSFTPWFCSFSSQINSPCQHRRRVVQNAFFSFLWAEAGLFSNIIVSVLFSPHGPTLVIVIQIWKLLSSWPYKTSKSSSQRKFKKPRSLQTQKPMIQYVTSSPAPLTSLTFFSS